MLFHVQKIGCNRLGYRFWDQISGFGVVGSGYGPLGTATTTPTPAFAASTTPTTSTASTTTTTTTSTTITSEY